MGKTEETKRKTVRHGKSSRNYDWMIIRWMLIMRPAIVTATLGVAILIIPKGMIDKFPIAVIVFGTYLLTILYWLAHKFYEIHRTILVTQIAFDIFIITVIIHYTGGIDSSFVGFYFLSIMCASLFFRRLVTFLISTQAVVFYVTYNILYLYYFGPRLDSPTDPEVVKYYVILQTFMYSVLMYAVGFISSSYAERIFKKDTALISALKLLKEARLDTSDILQCMTNGLITVNMSGLIVYINRAAEKILHIEHENAEGRKFTEVLEHRAYELVNIIKNEISGASEVSEKEINVFDPNGYIIPLGLTCAHLYDTDKSLRGVIVNFKDLTEKNKLIEMIRQSERMAAIGELSAAIAHEIRNPLGSISNAVEILKESYDVKDTNTAKILHVLENESERLQRISTDFLKFAKVKEPEINKLNLNKTIEEVLILVENDPRNTDHITIKSYIDENIYVLFDEDHFRQVILNIIINSLEAMEGEGEIVINTDSSDQLYREFIRLVIYDNGPGFPKEALGSMFEPFFSTKTEGTGLGLALVRKLIINNNGRVLARNKENAGAEIALDIPLYGVE